MLFSEVSGGISVDVVFSEVPGGISVDDPALVELSGDCVVSFAEFVSFDVFTGIEAPTS